MSSATPDHGRPVRVALVDDDDLVRAGLTAIFASDPGITIVAEARNGDEAVAMTRSHILDVVLLDIRMPGLDGITALRRIRGQSQSPAVAMLTTFSDDELIEDAVAAGTDGFLLKSDAPADLIRSVHALRGGGAAFSPRVARWLLRTHSDRLSSGRADARDRVARLSGQQRRLLAVLATGASNAEIARELHLSEGTVKQYLRDIFAQLGAANRVQAAILAHEAGLGIPAGP